MQIAQEELAQPALTRDQIVFWLHRFRKLDTSKVEHRRRLINSFVNAIYLYDDHLVFVGNYKDGSKTVTFAELEAAGFGSDLTACAVPKTSPETLCFRAFSLSYVKSINRCVLDRDWGCRCFCLYISMARFSAMMIKPFVLETGKV